MVRRILGVLLAVLLSAAFLALPPPVGADGHATIIASFEDTVAPEGIIVADDGTVYVSTATGGQLWAIASGESEPTVVATIDDAIDPAAFGVLGLWLDGDTLYAASATLNPATHGVWAVDLTTGGQMRVPGSEAAALPNSVVVVDGVVYFTDSVAGGIWRQSGSDPAAPWFVDDVLAGTGAIVGPEAPIGANGIAFANGTVYASNTEKASVVGIPVAADGSAGTHAAVSDPALGGIDGIATDADGNIYAVTILSASLLLVDLDGTITPVADLDDGLDVPSSVAIGPDGFVYVVNFSIGEAFGLPGVAGPGVVRVDPSAALLGDRDFVAYTSGRRVVPSADSDAWAWSEFRLRSATGIIGYSTSAFDLDSPIIGAHLRVGGPGENGPIVLDLSSTIVDGNRLEGEIRSDDPSRLTLADLVDAIDAGEIYLEIQTENEPSGAMRGSLVSR